jgi:hypothetical protein
LTKTYMEVGQEEIGQKPACGSVGLTFRRDGP